MTTHRMHDPASTRLLACALAAALAAAAGCAGHAGAGAPADASHAMHAHASAPRRVVPEGAGAPLFNDLGAFRRATSARGALAPRYFDQGLLLAYGFNHAEAHRSFAEASRQDATCAICAWGEALVLGPNINKPMDPADAEAAVEASRRALALAANASDVERALIEALAVRYEVPAPDDRSRLDAAYADAMRDVAARFPDDDDVQTLFAESLMDTMPWDYYESPATPRAATREIVAALERVMERSPEHPGALHLYIHAVEPSDAPERAEPAADTLGGLAPGAGHLVHMPSHVYLRIGRYADASAANELAAAADESYITQCRAQGFYPAAYYPHNIHFLYASAAFEGRSAVSIAAARKLSAAMEPEVVAAVPVVEEFVPMELYALVRFGRWEEILAAQAPPPEQRYATGVWRFARGMAHAALDRPAAAQRELAMVLGIAAEPGASALVFTSGATPAQLLGIGADVLHARIALEAGRHEEAIDALEAAVAAQDALPYTEPPPWYAPVRETLGAALLAAGRPGEAEAVFAEQLAHTPRNGWTLQGLVASLEAQGKDASEERRALEAAWERADFALDAPVL